jgi:hypothetical protein
LSITEELPVIAVKSDTVIKPSLFFHLFVCKVVNRYLMPWGIAVPDVTSGTGKPVQL